MLTISLSHTVNSLVRQLLIDTGGKSGQALYFNFDVELSYYAGKRKVKFFNSRCGLHLLYHVIDSGRVVDVFSGVTSTFGKKEEVQWKHECSHDSCWEQAEIFSELYFKLAKDVSEKAGKDIAPIKMTTRIYPVGFRTLFSWVPVKVERIPGDYYKKNVEIIKESL